MDLIKSKPVVTIAKNKRESIWFSLDEFMGKNVCNMRVFVTDKKGTKPTRKGLVIAPELLSEFIKGAEALRNAAVERGLLEAA